MLVVGKCNAFVRVEENTSPDIVTVAAARSTLSKRTQQVSMPMDI